MRLGALEAGGTRMTLTVGSETGEIFEQIRMPTTTPEEMLPLVVDYFRGQNIYALGIACFGPLDLKPDSPSYGYITTTPKPGWSDCPILPVLR